MTEDEIVLQEIRNHIDSRPDKDYIYARANELCDIIERWGEVGVLVLALIGAQMAVKA